MSPGVFSQPFDLAATGTARWMTRHLRLAVPLLIVLICGSFAAAALLQIRQSQAQANMMAAQYETRRAKDLAAVASAALDRFAEAGALYAGDPAAPLTLPRLLNIAVFDQGGASSAALHPDSAMPLLPPEALKGQRTAFRFGPEAALSFASGGKVILVLFDPGALAPASLSQGAAIAGGDTILGHITGDAVGAPVPGWPLTASVAIESCAAPWAATLPLTLFIVLGPALAGGWLAALFVGSFERQQKAAHAIRALKTTRPAEARLLVRLAAAERGAVEAVRAKSEFMAHMSHELRTPLNAVIGFSEVIAAGMFGPAGHPKYTEYAHDIAQAGRGLHTKIDDILEFANIEAGRYPLELSPVELSELAALIVDEHRGRAFSRRVRLEMGFAEPGLVTADKVAVRRALTHLITNALAYTGEGGAVLVEVRAEEACGLVRVADSGAGFSGAERARAGHAFQRFDRPGSVTGAGLGLAIAMELARRMGGAMQFANNQGRGTVMELRLPGLNQKLTVVNEAGPDRFARHKGTLP
jgi:signal transduction histidine kinase